MAQLTPPKTTEQLVTLINGAYSITIDPNNGARITAFSLNNKNCLTVSGPQIGSTFWPSPQESWGWPPPAVLDSRPYQATKTDESWVFTSDPCPLTHIVLVKIISPINHGFNVQYRMHNPTDNTHPVTLAPWEITRVDGGLTFYEAQGLPLAKSDLSVSSQGRVFWHNYVPAGFDRNQKLFANNSDGWLANVCNDLLLKKTFERVPEALVAPGEAEVEIYAHGDPENPYIEIEQQGAYQSIAPGQSTSWDVAWQLLELDSAIEIKAGNEALLKRVNSLKI